MKEERLGISYHHVFDAAVEARGSAASRLMGLRLIPIANEVLAAWPEYRYATKERCERGQHKEQGQARHTVRIELVLAYFALQAISVVSA